MAFWLVAAAILCSGIAVFYVVRRALLRPDPRCPQKEGIYPECLFVVRIAKGAVSVTAPDGSETGMDLRHIEEIAIQTNDSGPVGADVWWVLSAVDGRGVCTFPGGATGEQAALQAFQAFPGFDNKVLIRAMGSTSNRRFVVYRRG